MLALYRACLRLRRTYAAFRPVDRESWQAEALDCGIGAIRFKSSAGDWLLLFDLLGGHGARLQDYTICAAPGGADWTKVLSSNDPRFGGCGGSASCGDYLSSEHRHGIASGPVQRSCSTNRSYSFSGQRRFSEPHNTPEASRGFLKEEFRSVPAAAVSLGRGELRSKRPGP
jgi:hypothetical protein